MPAVTQDRESQKKIISEYLKAADRFIKSAEYPKALDEVNKALGVEPNNMYALAYNERVKVALEAARKKDEEEKMKKLADDQKKSSAPAAPKPPDAAPRAASAPDAKPQSAPAQPVASTPSVHVPGDDMLTKIKKEAADAAEKKSDGRVELLKQEFSAAQQKFQQDIAHLAGQAKEALAAKEAAENKLAALGQGGTTGTAAAGGSKEQSIALIKKLFQKAWEDGAVSPDERALLTLLKSEYGISDQDFARMENESGAASYISQLREVWKDGLVTPEEAETLEALRKNLNISAEEHFKLEAQVRKEMQPKK